MAAPTLLQTYPANNDVGIPIGAIVELVFDRGVDLSKVQDHVVLYGRDFDITSGPDLAIWTDGETGKNPFYLRSPGFQGLSELTFELVYVDLSTGPTYTEIDPGVIISEADELAFGTAGAGHKVKITPREPLAPDVLYNLQIIGDPDTAGRGIGSRTVFDIVADGDNTGTTGVLANHGGYTGTTTDTVNIEITTAGDVGTAKYLWYYTSVGIGAATRGVLTSRRFRRLIDGLQLHFSGSGFVLGDKYVFNVEPCERLAISTAVAFTSNDGTYTTAPASPSTPATSVPPATVIPAITGVPSSGALTVLEMTPSDGSFWNPNTTDQITVVFSDNLDAATVTDTSVKVWVYPVSGLYSGQEDPIELRKQLTVSGSTLTIDI